MDIAGEDDFLDHDDGQQRSNLNLSDVLQAITIADPEYAEEATVDLPEPLAGLAGPAADLPEPAANLTPAAFAEPPELVDLEGAMARPQANPPYVEIVEQPASKALRFRYECEGRSAGSIPGANSTPERRTHPTIRVVGYTGKAHIVVSCVTKDGPPYRPHPHNLVGREHCNHGVYTVKKELTDGALISFSNLGIQCVKRRNIAAALEIRKGLRIDPFRTGFDHGRQNLNIDLNAVRLCFQVYLLAESAPSGPGAPPARHHALQPVVSDVIYDKKAMSDLQILRTSQASGSVRGGTEVILLCEKVTREDITVVLCAEDGSWEEKANIILVHKQVAIAFTTPPYRDAGANRHIEVTIQLKRPSDNTRSNSMAFTYIPATQDSEYLKRKRLKTPLMQQIEIETAKYVKKIKAEPADKSPSHQMPFGNMDYPYQQWVPEAAMAGPSGAAMAGPSGLGGAYAQDMQWPFQANLPQTQARSPIPQNVHNLTAQSPNMQNPGTMSPNMQVMSPQGQVMSPNMQVMDTDRTGMSPMGQSPMLHQGNMQHALSPNMQVMSPNMQGSMSPNMQGVMSPNMQGAMSPHMQGAMSPHMQGAMSPHMQGAMSPHMQGATSPHMQGAVSPHMQMMSPLEQASPHMMPMDMGMMQTDNQQIFQLASGELSALLAAPGDARLSSSDLPWG